MVRYHILLQIVRFQVNYLPIIQSIPLTEDDNGVVLVCNTDIEITNQ
ncbi:unnamed protein product, partial [Rotaria sp. Silwood2]